MGDYSYSWGVRCTTSDHLEDCVEENRNWREYILTKKDEKNARQSFIDGIESLNDARESFRDGIESLGDGKGSFLDGIGSFREAKRSSRDAQENQLTQEYEIVGSTSNFMLILAAIGAMSVLYYASTSAQKFLYSSHNFQKIHEEEC